MRASRLLANPRLPDHSIASTVPADCRQPRHRDTAAGALIAESGVKVLLRPAAKVFHALVLEPGALTGSRLALTNRPSIRHVSSRNSWRQILDKMQNAGKTRMSEQSARLVRAQALRQLIKSLRSHTSMSPLLSKVATLLLLALNATTSPQNGQRDDARPDHAPRGPRPALLQASNCRTPQGAVEDAAGTTAPSKTLPASATAATAAPAGTGADTPKAEWRQGRCTPVSPKRDTTACTQQAAVRIAEFKWYRRWRPTIRATGIASDAVFGRHHTHLAGRIMNGVPGMPVPGILSDG